MSKLQFAWHVHHDRLLEPLTESIEDRRKYIKRFKPANEQALRLRLLKPVKGTLPNAYVKAWTAYDDARKTLREAVKIYVEPWKVYGKAWKTYMKALNTNNEAVKASFEALIASMPAIEALHNQECPNCPWNGQTIFSTLAVDKGGAARD